MDLQFYNLKQVKDDRGTLVVLEDEKDCPFAIKRIYFLVNLNKERRGFHSHKEIRQVIVCQQGEFKILLDDGLGRKEVVTLSKPNEALLIDIDIWHEMYDFSADCVIMVLASEHYRESDYIRNYDDFIRYVGEKHGKRA